jgi:hypothetical protein
MRRFSAAGELSDLSEEETEVVLLTAAAAGRGDDP